ncbi:hypothetical protein RHSIM_Rhsim03G0108600 [Rhododendron simsii]|uniref:Uncharacterized protein n=1 Tax=Rhododendron simsii TaxID=118357 RepID=A0A834H6Y6_RHOSS|nr:hypothetical protein RHSIM_Rhsim03G0108600 [Rhododendron simsii]
MLERIDMAFANAKWRELHNQAMVFLDVAIGLDHNQLILNTSFPLQKVGKPFRFESFWTTEESYKPIIEEAWAVEYEGIKMVKVYQLVDVQKTLELGFNPDYLATEKTIEGKLEDLWQKDAMFWHQHSRIKWLQMGDKNSRFFHLSTIQRRQRIQIVKLRNDSGLWKMEVNEIAGIIKSHFQSLYAPPTARNFNDVFSLIDPIGQQNVVKSEKLRTYKLALAAYIIFAGSLGKGETQLCSNNNSGIQS